MVIKFFFVLVLSSYCVDTLAQPSSRARKGDNLLLQKYKRLIEQEWGIYNERNPTDLIDDELIVEARDKKFKLFIYRGEQCGAHCNVFYDAFLHVNAGKPKAYHIKLYPVVHIYKLKDNTYLILQKGDDGGGNLQEDCLQATLISLKGNKMAEHLIKHPDGDASAGKSFLITQRFAVVEDEETAKENFKLNYNPITNQLKYSYLEANDNDNKVYRFMGYFAYVNGAFAFKSETKSKLP